MEEIQVLDFDIFTKKAVEIKAAQLTETTWNTISEHCPNKIFKINGQEIQACCQADGQKIFLLQTLEGQMRAEIYDWLIIGIKGEIYACKSDIFEKTYNEPSIITRKVTIGTKNYTEIVVLDNVGNGGANHEYEVRGLPPEGATISEDEIYAKIKFQKGAIKESGINGCHNEDLIAIVIDRLQGFQSGIFSCRENAIAITKLEEALLWLNKRTNDRIARGVEGTNIV